MKIRATILIALLAACWSSGALAGEVGVVKVDLNFAAVDTADYVDATEAFAVNDTIGPWTSYEFGPATTNSYSTIYGRILLTSAETEDTVGLSDDSIYVQIQSKYDDPYDSTWFTLWQSSLIPSRSFDSTSGWARGTGGIISIPSDSISSMGNIFRIRTYFVVEEDSVVSSCTIRSTETVEPYEEYRVYLLFRE